MKYFFYCFKHYFDFNGRARRKEFWFFGLFNCIITLALVFACIIPILVEITRNPDMYQTEEEMLFLLVKSPFLYIYLIYSLAVFIPGLAVSARRLHDVGRSGLWLILLYSVSICCRLFQALDLPHTNTILSMIFLLIATVVTIVYLVWCFTDSQYGTNKYGPNPKGEGNTIEEEKPAENPSAELPANNE